MGNREDSSSAEAAYRGDIAVVGVGCRYPGGVRDLDGLWQVISQGLDVTSDVPADRWAEQFLDRGRAEGTMYCGRGGFIYDIDVFDARFFGITPREAAEIDPQHRLLLQTAWEAMEDSGIPRDRWEGSRTGVFTGILGMDYTLLLARAKGPAGVGPYYASGKEASFGAGRIAYTFGLHGPCMMLNAACSSSLLAVHLASQALRAGECDAALAGGVNLMLAPELSIFMSRIEALSPTETCRPFDAAADGVVRGEGCGIVVLKRYADAVADGDRIHAVLKGSATVHDGRSAGLIAPNAEAQQMLLRSALSAAGVAPEDVDYIEAHCTGTSLGDHLEVSALTSVFGAGRDPDRPLRIGSHKANFGHTDSAAGVLGLLKGILVARHGVAPPQINVDTPMELLTDSGVRVDTEATTLPGDRPRLVGVSAFGLSGTNVHVILQSPPADTAGRVDEASTPQAEPLPVLVLSGPTPESLTAQSAAYRDVFAAAEPDTLPGLLHSASVRRTHHDYRLAVTGETGAALAEALDAHHAGRADGSGASGDVLGGRAPRIVHAFSGQGSQWPGMALDLYDSQPLVRRALDECDALVGEFAGWSLVEEIGRTRGSRLADTEFAQPAIFAVQVALSRLWTAWGAAPTAVVGHSVGEIAAAHTAGAIGLRDAVRLVVRRGRIMQDATGSGRMAQVELPPEKVRAALEPFGGSVVVATVNGPHSVVIAGPADAMEQAVAHLKRIGAPCMPLGVDYAFHSPAVRRHGDELEASLSGLVPEPARIPLLSSVDPEDSEPVTDAAYWGRNVREEVRFWPAVDQYLTERDALFIEIGPHPVLSRPLRDALAHRGRSGLVVPSLARGKSGPSTLAASLASLYTIGAPTDWQAVHPARGGHRALPPVALAKDRHWLPGLVRGEQGDPAASAARPLPLRAEIRLFDAEHRLVAAVEELSLVPSAEVSQRPPVSAPSAVPAPAPVPALAPAPLPTSSPADVQTAGLGHEQAARTVARIAAEVLGAPDPRLSRVRGFYELGFDSFSIVELVTRLGTEFGVDLPARAGVENPTIEAMTDRILGEAAARPVAVAQLAPSSANARPAPEAAAEPALCGPAADTLSAAPRSMAPPALCEPVAIVGMSCRLPGAVGLDSYWSLLSGGVDATGDVPADRWNAAALLDDSERVAPGHVATGRGGFIEDIDQFDNAFFRVSAREARSMDPQQRIFLEVAWEALEDAGLGAQALRGSRTGLFVGLNTVDYGQMLSRDPEQVDLYYGTGNTFSGSAGRMSYFLGVRGPSVAVDTACASSLTAVHLGCQSLRSGECDIAVVGGSNALLTPTVYQSMSAGGALAPDGRCKTFDASADGYGRGEGAGVLVLKTLSRAQADGDRIHAVIRGSAVNHNGASGGLTVPSADAQAEVISAALAQADIGPAEVDYVEAHGTGTPLGDPVELTALDRTIGAYRPSDRPLLVGSVKTNIAHLEAAAGVAGLIKTVLALKHGEIPPHLHFEQPSPEVPWDRLRLKVTAQGAAWPASSHPRTAGVSAFGFTGANAHVVLSEPPTPTPTPEAVRGSARAYALAVSAASAAALDEAVQRVTAHLENAADAGPEDLVHTLGVRRSHLEHRLVAVGRNREELLTALSGTPVTGIAQVGEPVQFALVFGPTVGGLPWERLYEQEPAFAAALDTVDAECRAVLGRSVRAAVLRGATDPVTTVAAQIAMAALWSDHGVRPDVVTGRGSGEIAAAHVAEVLGLGEAITAAAGTTTVRLSGRPAVALHLASAPADLRAWTPGSAAAFGPVLVRQLSDRGIEMVLDASLADAADELAALSPELTHAGVNGRLDAAAPVRAAAALHVAGCTVDWTALLAGRGRHISAPGYPWQHRRHWIDAPALAATAPSRAPTSSATAAEHAALGVPVTPFDAPAVRYYPVALPGDAREPVGAAALTGLLLAAGSDLLGGGAVELRDVDFAVPVVSAAALSATAGAQLVAHATDTVWHLTLVAGRHGARDARPVARATLVRPVNEPPARVEPAALRGRLVAPVREGFDDSGTTPRLSGPTVRWGWSAGGPEASPLDASFEVTEVTEEPGRRFERLASLRPTGSTGSSDDTYRSGTERRAWLSGPLPTAGLGLLASCLPQGDLVVTGVGAVRVHGAPHGETVLLHAVADGDNTGLVRVLAAGDGRVLAELTAVRYASVAGSAVTDTERRRIAQRLYTVRWQPVELPVPQDPESAPASVSARRWLVVAGSQAVSAAGGLAAALARAGADAQVVGQEPDWAALLADHTVGGIVLAATTAVTGQKPDDSPVVPALAAARAAAAAERAGGTPPRLWLVTRGAHGPEGVLPVDHGQAAAWGLARVLAMEAPSAWGGCLDLSGLTERDFDAAATALTARTSPDTVEDELALRDGSWYAPRLMRAEAPTEILPALHCDENRWYVVVGALSSAVRPVVDRLVTAGARRLLVLQPREEVAWPQDTAWAGETSAAGVTIKVVDLSASDFDDDGTGPENDVLAGVSGGEPIGGVVVASVPLPGRPLAATEPAHLAVGQALVGLAAKVELAVRSMPLEFFYVLGSAAASWGSVGMAVPGAVDGALASVAAARRAAGYAGAVIRWMPSADDSTLTRRDQLMMESSGLTVLTSKDVSEAVGLLLRGGYTDAAVARVDEQRFTEVCRKQTARGFFDLLNRPGCGPAAEDGARAPEEVAQADGPPLVAELLALSPQLRGDVLLGRVLHHVTDVLGGDTGSEVAPERGFFELGMDSVMAVALKARLDAELGVDLPATLTFEFPTARALARHLLDGLAMDDSPEGADEEAQADLSPAGDNLESLPDDELLDRLMAALATSEQLLAGEA
ncbi:MULTISPECIES: type I polyketide synthase [unclassified Streptomyces]|uniref:type I polyketide synthase n=1 Tax=unclassified Streptomyces TaxID=2593676 RepID=UPI002253F9CB|nr:MULTISPECIES: type I polyketide synthase [unclassified Streptomyces]WSP53041.1 acyltransferase domain-containing protein [Streptomyces sp. NBC_01241]MCX4800050.1 acyltransferase domain-containing protein [Streptomyces sp. NBC_01242]WSJ40761.1 acyltransferase domain-containing protein [Streptomyces sp. NBC_01321]WSP59810.1 acyltransferase domain-containing protein [Streptomyces sp. NBC_01241]WSP60551.1 acyltransferase domain-containing protein [Streptomyces sp. NBC_01240]